jgi:hypothetical protein
MHWDDKDPHDLHVHSHIQSAINYRRIILSLLWVLVTTESRDPRHYCRSLAVEATLLQQVDGEESGGIVHADGRTDFTRRQAACFRIFLKEHLPAGYNLQGPRACAANKIWGQTIP